MGEDKKTALCPMAGAHVRAGSHRRVQLVRRGTRKLFDVRAKSMFLECFAATCNVRFSAEQAGVSVRTVWRHRMVDPVFREACALALDQGYARIEAKIIETVITATPIVIDGDWDIPDLEIADPAIMQAMLRDHRQREARLRDASLGAPGRRRSGPKPGVASERDVKAALVRRLRAFGVRVGGGEPG